MTARKPPLLKRIDELARQVMRNAKDYEPPRMDFPIRALQNVEYDEDRGFFQIGSRVKSRTLSFNTVKTFAQTLRMISESKKLIESDDIASKREVYYVAKGWGSAKFDEQTESDTVMDDVEAFFCVNREQLRFMPEEKGGDVMGKLIIVDQNPSTGKDIQIDCMKFGTGAYSIPTVVEHLKFKTDAKFVLVVETAGAFQRLVKHNFAETASCIIISMGGVPTRACRRFIRRLSDERHLPVYAFTDGDPYGYMNIYRTLKVGSGNAAHINEFFCVPKARFLGVTPDDIDKYELDTHPLKDVDIKRAKDALKNDPFVLRHKPWQKALKKMIDMGVRVEQQAFAKHGYNFVLEHYLPEKLANTRLFLP
ncbi:MAG: DNA topoisomerase IV subunit A [Candidatus Omnitrophica bacterium]|nr:DNA topoisomerase IV subunit A [bacterium]MBK7495276.1 DNA topoisomerase IV subunit A [Candidatus Omnitrophota bacterium]MCE7908969.1 DNA topoisomerase VI [Candidatus Omnitrophica bacterium COP1]MBV6483500.1 Type 2 DNA topoisomerase 6 subunit A [bacterium]MCC6731624.1 DNA topoisomerase IV subunit A [Candidatus Omnitrophota bacterium]